MAPSERESPWRMLLSGTRGAAEVSWDSGNSSPEMSFYYPEASRFSSLSDEQWGKIVSYYELGQSRITSRIISCSTVSDKMYDNDYYVLIEVPGARLYFIKCIAL